MKKYFSNIRPFIASASWLLSERGIRLASGFFVSAAVARYLGPDRFGLLALALGTTAVFSTAAAMGADHINTAEIFRRDPKSRDAFIWNAILVRLAWSAVCLIVLLAGILIFEPAGSIIFFLLAALIPLTPWAILGNRIQADGNFSLYARVGIVAVSVGAVARIVGIAIRAPIEWFAGVAVIESSTLTAGLLLSQRRGGEPRVSQPHRRTDVATMRAYFSKCLPTAISISLVTVFLRLELFVVTLVLGQESGGLWAIVLMMITPWSVIAGSLMPLANRRLSLAEHMGQDISSTMTKLIRQMFLGGLVATGINILASLLLVPFVFGSAYDAALPAMIVSSFCIVPLFLGTTQELWIAQNGRTDVVLRKVLIGLPFSTVLLWLFLQFFGLVGAAASMLVSYIVTTLALNFFFDKEYFHLQMRALGSLNARYR